MIGTKESPGACLLRHVWGVQDTGSSKAARERGCRATISPSVLAGLAAASPSPTSIAARLPLSPLQLRAVRSNAADGTVRQPQGCWHGALTPQPAVLYPAIEQSALCTLPSWLAAVNCLCAAYAFAAALICTLALCTPCYPHLHERQHHCFQVATFCAWHGSARGMRQTAIRNS